MVLLQVMVMVTLSVKGGLPEKLLRGGRKLPDLVKSLHVQVLVTLAVIGKLIEMLLRGVALAEGRKLPDLLKSLLVLKEILRLITGLTL
jgi:hypothetical protein